MVLHASLDGSGSCRLSGLLVPPPLLEALEERLFLDTTGLFNPATGALYVNWQNASGSPYTEILRPPAPGQTPVMGDWDGDGQSSIGLYNPSTQTFQLFNSNTGLTADYSVLYQPSGAPSGYQPLVGDWTGDGQDGIGAYDPATQTFYLRNSLSGGAADDTFSFVPPGASANYQPLVGDWDGNGSDSIGLYDPVSSTFYLRNSLSGGTADDTFVFPQSPSPQYVALTGDWGNTGSDSVGLYDPSTSTFLLRTDLTPTGGTQTFTSTVPTPPAGQPLAPVAGFQAPTTAGATIAVGGPKQPKIVRYTDRDGTKVTANLPLGRGTLVFDSTVGITYTQGGLVANADAPANLQSVVLTGTGNASLSVTTIKPRGVTGADDRTTLGGVLTQQGVNLTNLNAPKVDFTGAEFPGLQDPYGLYANGKVQITQGGDFGPDANVQINGTGTTRFTAVDLACQQIASTGKLDVYIAQGWKVQVGLADLLASSFGTVRTGNGDLGANVTATTGGVNQIQVNSGNLTGSLNAPNGTINQVTVTGKAVVETTPTGYTGAMKGGSVLSPQINAKTLGQVTVTGGTFGTETGAVNVTTAGDWKGLSAYSKYSPAIGPDGKFYVAEGKTGAYTDAKIGGSFGLVTVNGGTFGSESQPVKLDIGGKWQGISAYGKNSPSIGPDGTIYFASDVWANAFMGDSMGNCYVYGGNVYGTYEAKTMGYVTAQGYAKWSSFGVSKVYGGGIDASFTATGGPISGFKAYGGDSHIKWKYAGPEIGPDGTIYFGHPSVYQTSMISPAKVHWYTDSTGKLKWSSTSGRVYGGSLTVDCPDYVPSKVMPKIRGIGANVTITGTCASAPPLTSKMASSSAITYVGYYDSTPCGKPVAVQAKAGGTVSGGITQTP